MGGVNWQRISMTLHSIKNTSSSPFPSLWYFIGMFFKFWTFFPPHVPMTKVLIKKKKSISVQTSQQAAHDGQNQG